MTAMTALHHPLSLSGKDKTPPNGQSGRLNGKVSGSGTALAEVEGIGTTMADGSLLLNIIKPFYPLS